MWIEGQKVGSEVPLMKTKRSVMACISILLLANVAAVSKQKPPRKSLVGTWKLNLAKSAWGKIPAPKEDTLVVTQDDEMGLKWTASGVSANGEQFSYSFEGAPDGKDYSMKSPNNEGESVSLGLIAESVEDSKRSIRRTAR